MRGSQHIRLEECITANNSVEDYSSGDLVVTRGTDFNLWGRIADRRSLSSVFDGQKRLNNHTIGIICRTRDVEDVNIGTELTLDSNNITYQVEDVFDHDFKFHSMVIASAVSN